MSAILLQENSNSFNGTLACLRYFRNSTSSGRRMSNAWPQMFSPRAVRPTRWMYSLVSFGGSYCTIQSTAGMSKPRAATSVHSKMPDSALQNWKNTDVRLACFCLPYKTEYYVKSIEITDPSMLQLTWIEFTGRSM